MIKKRCQIYKGDIVRLLRLFSLDELEETAYALGYTRLVSRKENLSSNNRLYSVDKLIETLEGKSETLASTNAKQIKNDTENDYSVAITNIEYFDNKNVATAHPTETQPVQVVSRTPRILDHQPIAPMRVVTPAIKKLLSTTKKCKSIDTKLIEETLLRNRTLKRVPYLEKNYWSEHSAIVLDLSPRLAPLHEDMWLIVEHLVKLRGKDAISTIIVSGEDEALSLSQLNQIVADVRKSNRIVLLSDLGVYDSTHGATKFWIDFAKKIRGANKKIGAFVPAPVIYWQPHLYEHFDLYYWDKTFKYRNIQRFTSYRYAKVERSIPDLRRKEEDILCLTTTAVRVEHRLLRAIRQSCGLSVDYEIAAWLSDNVYRTPCGFGFKSDNNRVPIKAKYEHTFSTLPQKKQARIRLLIKRPNYHYP